MLTLKRIRIDNKKAEADYYPETSEKYGYIAVNLATEDIETLEEVEGYSGMYIAHAISTLVRMANEKDNSNEKLVMWY